MWHAAALSDKGEPLETASFKTGRGGTRDLLDSMASRHGLKAAVVASGPGAGGLKAFLDSGPWIFPKGSPVEILDPRASALWAASLEAERELPRFCLAARTAVSLGRRFMDPLPELLKLGLGELLGALLPAPERCRGERDMRDRKDRNDRQDPDDRKDLRLPREAWELAVTALALEAETRVSQYARDVNRVPEHVLRRVPGLDGVIAKNIVSARAKGDFRDLDELRALPGMTWLAFKQCSRFLEIRDLPGQPDIEVEALELASLPDRPLEDMRSEDPWFEGGGCLDCLDCRDCLEDFDGPEDLKGRTVTEDPKDPEDREDPEPPESPRWRN
jgi:hypothetical protein